MPKPKLPPTPLTPKTFARKLWREWLKPLAVVLAIFLPIRSAIADWNDVPTGSMKPTILEGDRILVNKLAYGLRLPFTMLWLAQWDDPARGEIAVLHSPADGTRLVKRIVGIPGDTIELQNSTLIINGAPVAYSALGGDFAEQIDAKDRPRRVFASESLGGRDHPVMSTPGLPARRSFAPMVIPQGKYLVMGDNRDESADSRYFGLVPRGSIVGRSGRVAFSLDRDHYYVPRLGRFFRALP